MKTTHIEYKCPEPCKTRYCPICDGALFICTICDSGEGTLTTDCPGHRVGMDTQDLVYSSQIDFKDGEWVPGRSTHGRVA